MTSCTPSFASEQRQFVLTALRAVASEEVRETGPGSWEFSVDPGDRRLAAVLSSEQWLGLSVEVPGGRIHGVAMPQCAWELAEMNGRLAGGAKLVIDPQGSGRCRAHREIWLDGNSRVDAEPADDSNHAAFTELISTAILDLQEAIDIVRGCRRVNPVPRDDVAGMASSPGPDLEALSQQAGWKCHRRAEGRLAVDLDVPGMYVQAIVARKGQGLRATVTAGSAALQGVSRLATGLLLMEVGRSVRLARPAVRGEHELILETHLNQICPASLNEALSALSVACRMCIAELSALAVESIAKEYLALRGCSLSGE